MNIDELQSDSELDRSEDYLDSMVLAEEIEDENVDYYAELCKDDILDSCTRRFIISNYDKTNSNSIEEAYLKNVIFNNNILTGVIERELKYEQQRKE